MNWWIFTPIVIAAVTWTGASLWYGLKARWWKSAEGVNAWLTMMSVALLLVRRAVIIVDPTFREYDWVGALVYSGVVLTGAHRWYLIEKAQREKRSKA